MVGAKINSPHVVEVSDAGIDDATGTPWLTMELLQGRDLDTLIAGGRHLSVAEAWEILGQLGDVLALAHDAGVIHLDLKPENLFLSDIVTQGVRGPVLKVLDFGISRVLLEGRTSTEVTTTAGSPLWMAPEQTVEGARLRASSDVWSVGLIAFRMLTGKEYWREAHAPRVKFAPLLREVLYDTIVPASQRAQELGVGGRLPAGFDEWFQHCVEREAEKRFQHARAAFTALYRTLFPVSSRQATVVLDSPPPPPIGVEADTDVDLGPTIPNVRALDPARGTVAIPTTAANAAASLLDRSDPAAARDSLGNALQRDGSSAEVWAMRGECDLQLGRWNDAVTDFSSAIERAPAVGAYWYGRSLALSALGQTAMARTDMIQAAALGHPEARARTT